MVPLPRPALTGLSAPLLTALLFMALASGPGRAATAEGGFAVDGPGSHPCSDFTRAEAEKSDLMFAFAGWTTGFLTGVNVFRPETFDITPFQPAELILAKLAKYCAAPPDEPFVNALGRLVAVLEPARLREASPLVRLGHGQQAVFVYAAVLEDLRAKLAAEGHDPGGEPGSFDPAFAEAIIAFQKAKGLPASGLPDMATMNALWP